MDFLLKNRWRIVAGVLALFFIGAYVMSFPPADFPVGGNIVVITKGSTAPEVASELSEAHVIAHASLFSLILRLTGTSEQIQTGAYRFQAPPNLFIVAYRLSTGDYGLPMIRLTFVEGATIEDMAKQAAEEFSNISAKDFILKGQPEEGYLFPDTYFFTPGTDADSILKKMSANFDTKIAPLLGDVRTSGHSISDVVIMASIIEKEARTETDKHLIAGILWNRLAINMPLQVDAALETYKHRGFPAQPICNPGLASLKAAANPTKTDYLYYLTGHDGLMHYATTFAGHQSNLRKYLY